MVKKLLDIMGLKSALPFHVRERDTERETERQRETDREREIWIFCISSMSYPGKKGWVKSSFIWV